MAAADFKTIEDLRTAARRRLPRAVFDFIDGAAEDEITLRRNRAGFGEWAFSPTALVDVGQIDRTTTVLGASLALPLVLAPTGLSGMAASRPEVAAARAALSRRIAYTASCLSAMTLEQIAAEAPGPHWFQVYLWRDRKITLSLVERAAKAGYTTLVVTVDVPVIGQRERDARNGATIPPRLNRHNAFDTLRRPGWLLGVMRNPPFEFANLTSEHGSARRPFALTRFANDQFDPSITWEDVKTLRSVWRGPLVIKGIMRAEDAIIAAEHGVDGVVVSNHGGRQLDGLPASLTVLPEVVEAVGNRIEVLFDGGIRRGSDIVKALALGARACMVGRAYLYGLGAAGEAGAARAIEILDSEMTRTMALLGRRAIGDLDRTSLRAPSASGGHD